ncbi:hypothetical protein GCM10008965_38830 [Methylorubrum aminovorans]|nr:hypothetical protein GCM10025880_07440 [Methylorubrum aminovorans]
MNAPDHVIEDGGASGFVVQAGGPVSADIERPGLWIAPDQHGSLMGRHRSRKDGAEFLASWFIAEEPERS